LPIIFLLQDLAVLDAVLSSQVFIFGSEATFADSLVYSALTDKLPNKPANVVRWAQHMAALSPQQRQALPQNTNLACGLTQVTNASQACLWLLRSSSIFWMSLTWEFGQT
jgi:hypothetical protein